MPGKILVNLSLLLVSGQIIGCTSPGSRLQEAAEPNLFEVRLASENVAAPEQSFKLDFNGDQIVDKVTVESNLVTVQIEGQQEKRFTVAPRIHDAAVIALDKERRYPSLVLAVGTWGPTASGGQFVWGENQLILLNESGVLTLKESSLWLVGRGVDCGYLEERPACFFASFGDLKGMKGLSELAFVSTTGTFEGIGSARNLPFPVAWPGKRVNGFHMIGSAMMDYNQDGIVDIVSVGQHSQIFLALSKASDPQYQVSWEFTFDDYLAARATRVPEFPCVYIAIELKESKSQDHLLCFNHSQGRFSALALPKRYGNGYLQPGFVKADGNRLLFKAKTPAGTWDEIELLRQGP
jgi:hypothetical protein